MAALQDWFEPGPVEDISRRGGAADHDIEALHFALPVFKRNRPTSEGCSQSLGAFTGSIGDHHTTRASRKKSAGGFFTRVSGSNDEDFLVSEGIENVFREPDRRRGDAHTATLDFCFGANLLRRLEGPLKSPIQAAARVSIFQSELVGLFQLPEDFRLAHHHRVESRRHTEKVSQAVWLGERVELRAKRTFVSMELSKKVPHRRESPRRIAIGGDGVDFDAVASREDHGFLDISALPENLKRLGNPRFGKCETLSQLDR